MYTNYYTTVHVNWYEGSNSNTVPSLLWTWSCCTEDLSHMPSFTVKQPNTAFNEQWKRFQGRDSLYLQPQGDVVDHISREGIVSIVSRTPRSYASKRSGSHTAGTETQRPAGESQAVLAVAAETGVFAPMRNRDRERSLDAPAGSEGRETALARLLNCRRGRHADAWQPELLRAKSGRVEGSAGSAGKARHELGCYLFALLLAWTPAR
ncbi:hypothetical protein P280DRAFT_505837 [Massarina eburnea CBS 473.64]|uniref:Uncharacterized protein n=1 Tax=Massarina eburnea CBS 473.64 TaxID=1395130 RepID=A0A6A6S5F1_9PLEO|nr:hypothetical protein P280DRAFT_505837 [Massarina eburnea CBS 473.64]